MTRNHRYSATPSYHTNLHISILTSVYPEVGGRGFTDMKDGEEEDKK